jgi:hypothetical protein
MVDRSYLLGRSPPFFLLYPNLFSASVLSVPLRLTAFFSQSYLYEEAFSQMKIIKSTYRSRLTDKHLNDCLHLYLINYERYFSNLSQDMQRQASTSQ